MNFSIHELDEVIRRTNCTYEEAKEALLASDGEVIDAVIYLENKQNKSFAGFFRNLSEDTERTAATITEKIKAAIEEGSVSQIEVRDQNGRKLTSVSVNVGAAIGVTVLLVNGFLGMISLLVAKYGLNYQFVIVRKDGSEIVL